MRNQQSRVPTVRRRDAEEDFATLSGRGGNTLVPTVFRPQQPADLGDQHFNANPSPEAIAKGASVPYVGPYADRRRKLEEEREQLSHKTEKSEDSRLRSGAEAGLRALADAYSPQLGVVKNWEEFFGRLSRAPGAFAGGMINDKWDEEDARLRKQETNRKDLGQLDKEEDQYFQSAYKQSQMENMTRDDADRKARDEEKLKGDEEKRKLTLRQQLLGQIAKQNFYKKGANADFDQQLADADIELSDFDARRRETKEQAGAFFTQNPDTKEWEPSPGMPVDASEVPIDAKIGGVPLKIAPKQLAPLVLSQWSTQFNQQQQNNRQTKQITATQYQQARQQMSTYRSQWEANFSRTNFRMPTPEETRTALEAYAMQTWGYIPTQ
jgi:hypothetical protein